MNHMIGVSASYAWPPPRREPPPILYTTGVVEPVLIASAADALVEPIALPSDDRRVVENAFLFGSVTLLWLVPVPMSVDPRVLGLPYFIPQQENPR